MAMRSLELNNVSIRSKNFKGTKFNKNGEKSFCLVIDDAALAQDLLEEGWNVKIKPPTEEGDEPYCYVPVALRWHDESDLARLNPLVILKTRGKANELDEETVGNLDDIYIENIEKIEVRPSRYKDKDSGEYKIKVYLVFMAVVQKVDKRDEYRSMYGIED